MGPRGVTPTARNSLGLRWPSHFVGKLASEHPRLASMGRALLGGIARRQFAVSWAFAALVLLINAWPTWSSAVDDAYISARYAKHLVEGHGLVYNVGEPRIEGFTNLAWTLLLGALLSLGAPVESVLVALGFCFGVLALGAAIAATNTLSNRPSGLATSSAVLLAMTPHFAVVTTNGLETSMFVAGVLGACWAVFRQRARLAVGVACGVLGAIRPEGVLVAGLLVLWDLWQHRRRIRSLEAWYVALGCITLLGLVEGWRVAYYDAWLPNTFHAKTSQGVFAHLDYNKHQLIHDPALWGAVLACLLLACSVPGFRGRRLVVSLAALGMAAVALRVHMWMPGARLLVPSLALALCVGVASITQLSGWRRWTTVAALTLAISYEALTRTVAIRSADETTEASPNSAAAQAAQHLAAHAPEGAWLAIRDAGLFAYWVGTGVRVAETHQFALTQPSFHVAMERLPNNPEFIVTTVVRKEERDPYFGDRAALMRTTTEYEYLGRVKQHWHRFYDIFVRADLDFPALPEELVANRDGVLQLHATGLGKRKAAQRREKARQRKRESRYRR